MAIPRHIVFYATTQDYFIDCCIIFFSKIVFKLVNKNFFDLRHKYRETTELNSEKSMFAAVRNNSPRLQNLYLLSFDDRRKSL